MLISRSRITLLNTISKIFKGEPSGDVLGSKLIKALVSESNLSITFEGIGGSQMLNSGLSKSLFPMSDLSVMGFMEVLSSAFLIQKHISKTVKDIQEKKPDAVIAIDSKGFSFRVLKQLQDLSFRKKTALIQYVGPSVWAYKNKKRKEHVEKIESLLDQILLLLPFEKDYFHESKATWVGHPSIEDYLEENKLFMKPKPILNNCSQMTYSSFKEIEYGHDALFSPKYQDKFEISFQKQTYFNNSLKPKEIIRNIRILLLPGSRIQEIDTHLPIMREALSKLMHLQQRENKKIKVIIPTIPEALECVQHHVKKWDGEFNPIVISSYNEIGKYHLFSTCDVAISVSGTAVLDATLAGVPTVVLYKTSRITSWIIKRLFVIKYASIPNLILGRSLIPECLFDQCTSTKIAKEVNSLIKNNEWFGSMKVLLYIFSSLIQWEQDNNDINMVRPIRPSTLAAKAVLFEIKKKKNE